jgi:hypothetical protein
MNRPNPTLLEQNVLAGNGKAMRASKSKKSWVPSTNRGGGVVSAQSMSGPHGKVIKSRVVGPVKRANPIPHFHRPRGAENGALLMAIGLITYDPIKIDLPKTTRHIDKAEKAAFLKKLDSLGLSMKNGCYIFALRAALGYRPWYVGKATKSMKQECMALASVAHYNAVLAKGHKGTPVMFLVAPPDNKNKVDKRACEDIETFLIQSAYRANPALRNVQKAKIEEWSIKGLVRSGKGRPTQTQTAFKKMMGL